MKPSLLLAFAITLATLLSSCAESPYDDIHEQPRDTQSWENRDLSKADQAQLLAYLNELSEATLVHASAGEAIHFHHLEVAFTEALDALETQASPSAEATATIKTLRDLVLKLHLAGHDQNVAMGQKLAGTIQTYVQRLTEQLD